MREIRLSGSEGGGAEINRPSLPLSRPGTYGEAQQNSGRQFLFSMKCGKAAARALRKLPWYTVGTGCQPVPGHILHLGICVNPGSRLAAGTYWARNLRRGAAEQSQTISVLNELRRRRGKGSLRKHRGCRGRHRLPAGALRICLQPRPEPRQGRRNISPG